MISVYATNEVEVLAAWLSKASDPHANGNYSMILHYTRQELVGDRNLKAKAEVRSEQSRRC